MPVLLKEKLLTYSLFNEPTILFQNHGYEWSENLCQLALISAVASTPVTLKGWLSSLDCYTHNDRDRSDPLTFKERNSMLAIVYGAFHNPLILSGEVSISKSLFLSKWKTCIIETLPLPEIVMIDLATDPSLIVRKALAGQVGLSELVQKILLYDSSIEVKRALAKNNNVEQEIRIMAGLS